MTATFNTINLAKFEALERDSRWPAIYPRHYHTPLGYLSSRHAAYYLGVISSVPQRELIERRCVAAHNNSESDDSWRGAAGMHLTAREVIDNGVPAFWLEPALVSALQMTRPPTGIQFKDVPWPFPAFMFYLPKGGLTVGDGMDCALILVSTLNSTSGGLDSRDLYEEDGVKIAAFCPSDAGIFGDLFVSERNSTTVLDAGHEAEIVVGGMQAGAYLSDPKEALDRLTNLAVNACYYMAQAPEAVEPDTIGGKKKKGKEARAWWTPRWVGRSYKLPSVDHGGTHNSPRMHWRRGHFRGQHYGEGRQQLRQIWIQPVLVNADTSDTGQPLTTQESP